MLLDLDLPVHIYIHIYIYIYIYVYMCVYTCYYLMQRMILAILWLKKKENMRYEDLCLHWDAVREELVGWEPLLSDVDISTRPSGSGSRRTLLPVHHSHAQKSIKEYCESKVFDWERREMKKGSDDLEHRISKASEPSV